jgi:uncharacterized protein (TIGR02285 family)
LITIGFSQEIASEELLIISSHEEFGDRLSDDQYIGPVTESYKLLFQKMGIPENLQFIPTSRANVFLERAEPVCVLFNRITPEREKRYLFSYPISFGVGHRLYQQSGVPEIANRYLNDTGEIIAVDTILNDRPRELIIVLPNSSYGDLLDSQLSKISEHQKVSRWSGNEHNSQGDMFVNKRADFALLMASEAFEYLEQQSSFEYRRYAIADVTKVVGLHVMCNRTKASQDWLNSVNSAMQKLYATPEYLQAHARLYEESNRDDLILIKEHINQLQMEFSKTHSQ